jgi:hypothetical protein
MKEDHRKLGAAFFGMAGVNFAALFLLSLFSSESTSAIVQYLTMRIAFLSIAAASFITANVFRKQIN